MKIQDQVCTIEQAIRLKELGVAQISYFFWQNKHGRPGTELVGKIFYNSSLSPVSAFTGSELGKMFFVNENPRRSILPYPAWDWENDEIIWRIPVADTYKRESLFWVADFKTEAQARAAALIALIKNDNKKLHEINKTLTHD